MRLELIATATFGLEAVVRREIEKLGYEVIRTENGKVTFFGDERGIARANLWLRSADRVLIKMGEFTALEFEDLFQCVKGMAWEELIPPDGNFVVSGSSVKSKLSSVPACQRVAEKGIVERLSECYGIEHFDKSGALYKVKISLLKDRVTVTVDTSGDGLHKRGYRVRDVAAPIKETLAAALVQLSFWNPDRRLVDPCCGSATIAIEAAMIGKNIAPGLSRDFVSETWGYIDEEIWKEERTRAFRMIEDRPLDIIATDIDKRAIEAAKENAGEAGVGEDIYFFNQDIAELCRDGRLVKNAGNTIDNGIMIANPPYGMRIGEEKQISKIYEAFREFFAANSGWSLFMITMDKDAEKKCFGRPANRRRKLYNGRLQTCYYQFHGDRIKTKTEKTMAASGDAIGDPRK